MKINILYRIWFFSLCAFAVSAGTYGQSSLDWTAESGHITINGVGVTTNSSLTKDGDNIVWTQASNEVTESNTFVIGQVSGSWDSQSSTGQKRYVMNLDGHESHLEITGNSNGITMALTIFIGTVPNIYIFEINTFSLL